MHATAVLTAPPALAGPEVSTTDVSTTDASTAVWHAVGRTSDFEPLWGEAALVDGVQVAVVVLPDGRIFAVDNRDPVAEANVMSRGIVGSRGDRATIASPLHKEIYDLATGERLGAEGPALTSYPVRVRDDRIEVAFPAPRAVRSIR